MQLPTHRFKMSYLEYEAMMRQTSSIYTYTLPRLPSWVKTEIIYPFGGVCARVVFSDAKNKLNRVSTYLDVNDAAGCVGRPYFEAYPIDGDAQRFLYSEQADLYREVIKELKKRKVDNAIVTGT